MSLPYASPRWPAAATTLGLWALAAASVVFWGLRLTAPADALPPPSVASTPAATIDPAAIATLFGAVPAKASVAAAPEAASRFSLLGVVADAAQLGAALIAVDGKPPRPFRVGSQLADGYVLQSVGTRSAVLGSSIDSPAVLTLELPVQPMAIPAPPAPG
jgi:general secretion pathway protein C